MRGLWLAEFKLWVFAAKYGYRSGMSEPDAVAVEDNRSNWERMRAGQLYRVDPTDPRFNEIPARSSKLLEEYRLAFLAGEKGQADALLRQVLGDVGQGVTIRPPLAVDYGCHISVGNNVFINFGLIALDVADIIIGDCCQIGPNVQLLTPIHPLDPPTRKSGLEGGKPITIGNNVWLGGGVIVCPGVTIGDDAVVGAGSVVVKDIPAGAVAVGNPAKVIRNLYEGSGQ